MSAALLEYDTESLPIAGKYKKVLRPSVDTYSYVVEDVRFVRRPAPAVLPLFSFVVGLDLKLLRRPLLLRVAIEEGEYFVENDALRIFGHGSTLQGAVEAFQRDIAYFWQYYRDIDNDQVVGEGAALKQRYADLVA